MLPKKIGIIGLGLIGGTLAKTIHHVHPNIEIIACDPNTESLQTALEENVIAQGTSFITKSFADCRYIFLSAPVQQNENYIQQLKPFLNEACILSDTGSVKSSIHHYIQQEELSSFFIGGHPMAGSEKSGYENATPYLFENAYFIITYTDRLKKELLEEYIGFITSLGCIPFPMTPQEHDYTTAAVSHLPHILASSLVNLVENLDNDEEFMKSIAAGGFKDITRIASSSPVMWQEICETNQKEILLLLQSFITSLEKVKGFISKKESKAILDFFQQAKNYRDSLPIRKQGSLPSIYEIYCDLIDKAGGIATIATILATNGISIKNIGIIHNREYEQGVLRIEFYAQNAMEKAVQLLRKHHYQVYER